MALSFTRAQLLSDINGEINGKIAMISSQGDFANQVAREVNNDLTIRSTRRKADLSPNLFPGIYQYACPSDLRDYKIIDIPAQVARQDGSFNLVPTEQFATIGQVGDIAIDDYNGVRTLLINSDITTESITVSTLDTITSGGGTWTVTGGATNLSVDGDDYIKGGASLVWDIGATAVTTAGIQNSTLNAFELDAFLGGNSSLFVWHKINSTTNITSYTLKIGSTTGNYYSKTITTRHDGNAFQTGWNLLRFPLTSLTATGTPDDFNTRFISIVMDKTATKVSESDYKFDNIVIMKGVIHEVTYYSKYGWTSAAGTYLEASTSSSDLLVADTSEYELFVKKGKYKGLQYVGSDPVIRQEAKQDYLEAVAVYKMNNTDESKIMVTKYYND